MARRPWRERVWFYKPQIFKSWHMLDPWSHGGDEFNWHCLIIGFPWTGQIIIATKPCTGEGKCGEDLLDPDMKPEWILASEWPLDTYGHDHSKPESECTNPNCWCEKADADA